MDLSLSARHQTFLHDGVVVRQRLPHPGHVEGLRARLGVHGAASAVPELDRRHPHDVAVLHQIGLVLLPQVLEGEPPVQPPELPQGVGADLEGDEVELADDRDVDGEEERQGLRGQGGRGEAGGVAGRDVDHLAVEFVALVGAVDGQVAPSLLRDARSFEAGKFLC